jgi:DNA-directed RNA polymerase specialized sigma subunit
VRSEDHKRYAALAGHSDDGESSDATKEADKLVQKAIGKHLVQPALLQDHLYEIKNVIWRIRVTISDRADLVAYFDLYMQDLKRSEIAQRLGVSLDRVDELRKQFIERTLDVYREFFDAPQPANEKEARLARN